MPDHVGERFGAEEVHAGLDRRRKPQVGHVELDRDRQPGREAVDGRGQPALGEDRGVDAGRDLAQVLEPVPGVADGPGEQLPGLLGGGIPLLLGELEIDERGHEPLLGAVVQVAGDAPAGLIGSGHQPGPRCHQLLLRAPAFGNVADVAGKYGLGRRPGPGHRHLRRELAPVGAHRRHLETLVQDAPLPGGHVPGETLPVRLAQGRRHDQLGEFPARHLAGPVAEDVLERAVHVGHAGEPVNADDRVEGGFQDGPLASLAGRELGRPGSGDVTIAVGLAAHPGLGHAVQAGQFHAQHGRRVLQRGQVGLARLARRVGERDDAARPGPRAGQNQPGPGLVHRARRDPQPADEFPPFTGRQPGEGIACHVARGGARTAGLVLDHHAEPGELVQGLGDAGRPGGGRDLVQPAVDLHDLGQGRHGRIELGVERRHQLAVHPFGRDQLQPGDDRAAQLREHGQQEDLLGGEGITAGHHQEDRLAPEPGHQRERPAGGGTVPAEPAGLGQDGQGVGEVIGGALVVISRLAGMPGHGLLAVRDGRDGRGDQADEIAGRRRLSQDQRQGEDRVHRRQAGVGAWHRIVRAGRAQPRRRHRVTREADLPG